MLDEGIIEEGPRIDTQRVKELTDQFSKDDIKAALFDIGNDKSPGPDRYTSYFFKKTWRIVGDEFCEAVLEIFRTGKLLK